MAASLRAAAAPSRGDRRPQPEASRLAAMIAPHAFPSANHDRRAPGAVIDLLLLHYTGMATSRDALERLCATDSRVSAHYLIDESGRVHALVDEGRRAWHAGVSGWAGRSDINSCSIGIELANPGHDGGCPPFPDPQMEALIALCREILSRHPIPPSRVLGHSDVAPARKLDPGEAFDWARLASAGIGLWPPPAETLPRPAPDAATHAAFLPALGRFGYPLDLAAPDQLIDAFHRHFRPAGLGGPVTCEDAACLAWLNARAHDDKAEQARGERV